VKLATKRGCASIGVMVGILTGCGAGQATDRDAGPAPSLARCAGPDVCTSSDGPRTNVVGEHFRLVIDGTRGGQLTDVELFDGAVWKRVLGADGQTFPGVTNRIAR
jgi:hypothetical protein